MITISLVPSVNWADVVTATAACGSLFAVIWGVVVATRTLKLNAFSAILKEISSDKASRDRGLVRSIQGNEAKHIKGLVQLVRDDDTSRASDLGRAAERTIARMDRVGFFLMGNGTRLRTDTPDWLWTLVKDMWEKLGDWVDYRRSCQKEDLSFYHNGYGLYFKKLEDYRREHNL